MAILTDAELLALAIPEDGLAGVTEGERDAHRLAASGRVVAAIARKWSGVTTYGPECQEAAAALAAYSLLARRGYRPVAGAADPVLDRAKRADEWLALVSMGQRDPDVDGTRVGAPIVSSLPSRGSMYGTRTRTRTGDV